MPHLDAGDTIVDGGNSHFRDTQRRTKALAEKDLRFLGVGVSGGEEGALEGPSIMPGGDRAAYADVEHVLTTIAAQVDGEPCCTYVGPDGAGHYVKMVHNGIEYADIQLIVEAYDLLRHGVGLEVPEVATVFEGWNEGDLDSFLIEITGIVLGKTDAATGRPLVDLIVDEAEQKGTGRWTAQDALELGVPLTAITEAVFARTLSARRSERAEASRRLAGPRPEQAARLDRSFVDDVQRALYASKVVAYAQGFAQMAAASEAEGWDVDLGRMATIWRGGCIIRATFLDRIREAYDGRPAHAEPAVRRLLPRRGRRGPGLVAPGRRRRHRAGHRRPRVLFRPLLVRRLPAGAGAGERHSGAARLLRGPHLPATRPGGQLPHPVGAGRRRGPHGPLNAYRSKAVGWRGSYKSELAAPGPHDRHEQTPSQVGHRPAELDSFGREVRNRRLHVVAHEVHRGRAISITRRRNASQRPAPSASRSP